MGSKQPYVRLKCWQANWKIIGISSEDERLNTGSLGSFGDSSLNHGQTAGVIGVGPQLSAALEAYLALKGAGRPKTYEALMELTKRNVLDADWRQLLSA